MNVERKRRTKKTSRVEGDDQPVQPQADPQSHPVEASTPRGAPSGASQSLAGETQQRAGLFETLGGGEGVMHDEASPESPQVLAPGPTHTQGESQGVPSHQLYEMIRGMVAQAIMEGAPPRPTTSDGRISSGRPPIVRESDDESDSDDPVQSPRPRGDVPCTKKARLSSSPTGGREGAIHHPPPASAGGREVDISAFMGTVAPLEDSPSDDHVDTGDAWWSSVESSLLEREAEGPELGERFATLALGMLEGRLTEGRLKELTDLFPRPSNVPMLTAPKVNEQLWQCLDAKSRHDDLALQAVANLLATGVSGGLRAAEEIVRISNRLQVRGDEDTSKSLLDIAANQLKASQICIAALHTTSQRRRVQIKRSLGGEYKALCNPPVTEGVFLLGDDVSERIKALNETSKLGQQLVGRTEHKHKSKGKSKCQIVNHDHETPVFCNTLMTDSSVCRAAAPQAPAGQEEGPEVGAEQVNQVWSEFVNATISLGRKNSLEFQAGRLKNHVQFWKTLTTDRSIIQMILGAPIQLTNTAVQDRPPVPYVFPAHKSALISREISDMCRKGVIVRADHSSEGFVSRIFTRDKSDGSTRIILDLSDFNDCVEYKHFKMDSLQTALNLMSPGCYMASIDWKDAYYSVPIKQDYQKYLKFEWEGKMYQYTCFPNGLTSAPRDFTKITKVLFSHLRKAGHISTNYIDDCCLIGKTEQSCWENVRETVKISQEAGFVIHHKKSALYPSKQLQYLGYILNSQNMTVRLTPERQLKIKQLCQRFLCSTEVSLQRLSRLVGLFVSALPGVNYGQSHYRACERLLNKALKRHKGNYKQIVHLTELCRQEIAWWEQTIEAQFKPIRLPPPVVCLLTDASKNGWGAVLQRGTDVTVTGGHWSKEEAQWHINLLELQAIAFAVQCFCKNLKNSHIKVKCDNTTAVAYVNNQGGRTEDCNNIAKQIWTWCYEGKNIITCVHLPGELNVEADRQSRSIHDNMEWHLDPELFKKVCKRWGEPTVDLFASRMNKQVNRYYSWKPDPGAAAVDAMSESWSRESFYAFPPFNMVTEVLRKIEQDEASGVIVVPYWTAQSWFPKLTDMCIDAPCIFSSDNNAIRHPWRKMASLPAPRFMVAQVSGCVRSEFTPRPWTGSYSQHGGRARTASTARMSADGPSIVVRGTWIRLGPL